MFKNIMILVFITLSVFAKNKNQLIMGAGVGPSGSIRTKVLSSKVEASINYEPIITVGYNRYLGCDSWAGFSLVSNRSALFNVTVEF